MKRRSLWCLAMALAATSNQRQQLAAEATAVTSTTNSAVTTNTARSDNGNGVVQSRLTIHRRDRYQQQMATKRKQQQREPINTVRGRERTSVTSTSTAMKDIRRDQDQHSKNNSQNSSVSGDGDRSGGLFNRRTTERYIERIRTITSTRTQQGQNINYNLRKRHLAGGEDKDKDKDKDKNAGGGGKNDNNNAGGKNDNNNAGGKNDGKDDNNNKPNNNKGGTNPPTRAPTPNPTPVPTPLPTKYPTRSPAILPWTSYVDGYINIAVSIFTHEDDNLDILEGLLMDSTDVDVDEKTKANVRSSSDVKPSDLSVSDVLPRLNAGDILSGKEPELIKDVLSTTANIYCQNINSDDTMLLNVVDGEFYDYCGGITGYEPNATAISLENLPSEKDVMVTDITDSGTMLLKVEDRSVYVNNWREDEDGNEEVGDYLHWTVWTVQYAVLQVYTDVVNLEEADGAMREFLIEGLLGQIQQDADQAFASAISDGTMDEMLSEKSDNVLAVSSVGWEVETFTRAIDELFPDDDNQDGRDGDGGKPNGAVTAGVENGGRKRIDLIRMVGIILLVAITLFAGLLMKVGHERYRYEVWDATQNEGGKSDVNLVTYEGVDFMLDTGRNARATDPMLKSRSTSSKGSGPEEVAMDMGNSPSELIGQGPPPSPSPVRVQKEGKLTGFIRRFGNHGAENEGVEEYDDFTVAEAIVVPKISSPWTSSSNFAPPPPPETDSPTTSALLRSSGNDPAPTTPQNSRRFRFGRGGRAPSIPGTPEGAERIQDDEAGDFAFISVSNKSKQFGDSVRRSSTL